MEWQPIETAPKNCQSLLLWFDEGEGPAPGAIEGWWHDDGPDSPESGWLTIVGFVGEPTHWATLEPPQK